MTGERGRLILFVHGFPELWVAWHRQLHDFGRDHRAVALDQRGYNLSGKPSGPEHYSLSALADDLRHVLRTLSPGEPAVVVGHDWGGLAGWALAHESPELLHRLVIINAPHPAVFRRELKRNPRQVVASSYAAVFQLRGVAERLLRLRDHALLRAMVFGQTTKPERFDPSLRAAYRAAWDTPGALTAGLNYYRCRANLRAFLGRGGDWRVEVPTLVLWANRDVALRPGNLRGLEAYVPRLTVRQHARATHWVVHEEPEWVEQQIREFVT